MKNYNPAFLNILQGMNIFRKILLDQSEANTIHHIIYYINIKQIKTAREEE